MDALAPAVDATTGVVANPLFKGFNPLKFMLASLGIPVDHLVEGSRKCVAELGPEAMGALKALLVICPPPNSGHPPCACAGGPHQLSCREEVLHSSKSYNRRPSPMSQRPHCPHPRRSSGSSGRNPDDHI